MRNDRHLSLPSDLDDRVEEHARRRGSSSTEAYADLVERGLAAFDDDPVADGSGVREGGSGELPTGEGADDRTVDPGADGGDRRDADGGEWDVPETFADVAPTRAGRLRWFGTLLLVLGIAVAAGYALLLVLGLSYFGVDPTGGIAIALATAAVGLLLLLLGWIGSWLGPYATLFGRRVRVALDPDDG